MAAPSRPLDEIGPPRPIVVLVGRSIFWLGAGFTTLAAPWMLGGEPLVTQWWLLWGATMTFVGGLLVRLTAQSTPGTRAATRVQAGALLFGLLFVGYVYLQARNPSLRVAISGKLWVLSSLQTAAPGPHSIDAPLDFLSGDWMPYRNAWRYLLVFGACWIYAAGLVLGLVERADARRWVLAVGLNAALLAIVCLVHRALGERLTLWRFADTVGFTGSPVFFYKNHNGAYLAASLAVVLGLAWSTDEKLRRHAWEIVALFLWAATVAVNSRVATGLATLWIVGYVVLSWRTAWRERRSWSAGRMLVVGGTVVLLAAIVGLTGGRKAIQRFTPALSSPLEFVRGGEYRGLLRKVGLEMWLDQPVWGWGGGSYLYLFNTYQARVPQIAEQIYREQPNLNRFYMVSADSDWVEFLVEYGAIGFALLGAGFALLLLGWLRWSGWSQGMPLFLVAGAVGIVLHGYLDHVLRNPALLFLVVGLMVVAVRLVVSRNVQRHRPHRPIGFRG
jgi:O-antigen ligase